MPDGELWPGGDIWVVCDSARAGRELVTLGMSLSPRVVAFVPDRAVATTVAGAGAAAVYVAPAGEGLPGRALSGAVAEVAEGGDRQPDVVLFPMSFVGREAGARLSARWDRPVITNVHRVEAVGGTVAVESTSAAATIDVRTEFAGPPPWLIGVRQRSVEVPPLGEGGPGPGGARAAVEVVEIGPGGEADALAGPRVVGRHREAHDGVALEDAEVVVAGGRGLLNAEGFALVGELAALLGGAVGATRAAVDAGWAPRVAKVGLTGKAVSPALYLAFGISGASQHLVGMVASRHVVAVNTDRNAPIFGVAELGVVGDATGVLRRLVEDLRARREEAAPPR